MKKAQIWRARSNIATHLQGKSGDNPITEQEARLFFSRSTCIFIKRDWWLKSG